jgi:hypothetical protein
MLNLDWYFQEPIDFEHKNYILLAYLQEVDFSFSQKKLSPYLLHTELLVKDMKFFIGAEFELRKKFIGDIKSFDLERGLIREEFMKNETLDEIRDIVKYSIPLLESKVDLGFKLLKKYPQILF